MLLEPKLKDAYNLVYNVGQQDVKVIAVFDNGLPVDFTSNGGEITLKQTPHGHLQAYVS